jgi:hypothetical protein
MVMITIGQMLAGSVEAGSDLAAELPDGPARQVPASVADQSSAVSLGASPGTGRRVEDCLVVGARGLR